MKLSVPGFFKIFEVNFSMLLTARQDVYLRPALLHTNILCHTLIARYTRASWTPCLVFGGHILVKRASIHLSLK